MRSSRWAILAVLTFGALQVAGLVLDRPLLPYAGTLATAALLAVLVLDPAGETGWPRRAGLGGLAALTLTAAVVDARNGGNGWPMGLAEDWGQAGDLEIGLLAVAAVLLATAVLGRVPRLIRWGHLPTALFAMVVALVLPETVAVVPVVAAVLVVLAVNAALLNGRRTALAGAGLLPVLALLIGSLSVLSDRAPAPPDESRTSLTVDVELRSPTSELVVDAYRYTPSTDRIYAETLREAVEAAATANATGIGTGTVEVDHPKRWRPGIAATLLLLGLVSTVRPGPPRRTGDAA